MAKSKTRRVGDAERFPYIPESAWTSEALKTAPHAAVHLLCITVLGNAKDRNGTLACTDTYAAKFGFRSRETVYRSLHKLEERGLMVKTRPGYRMRRVPTLWAVTWWPIFFRDGQPLLRPEPATYAYLHWRCTPISGAEKNSHTDYRGSVTPMSGANGGAVHTDLAGHSPNLHTDGREYSESLGMGALDGRDSKVLKLMIKQPHLPDSDVAKITREPIEFVQQVRGRQQWKKVGS
jgi:hypothetical protein